MVILKQTTNVSETSFPLCSFGHPARLHATLWTTSEHVRSKFADLECTHSAHVALATNDAFPAAMSITLAQAIARTATSDELPEFTTKIDGMHPIFARYDLAATGLHRRSARANDPSLNALLATAADIVDMPLCLFCQDDVPSKLNPPSGSLLTAASATA